MVRRATVEDLDAVAYVHAVCFPESFSTVLGSKYGLLTKFYYEYFSDAPELFFVAEDDKGTISGFCMGYYCERGGSLRKWVKHNPLRIGIRMIGLLLMGNKIVWKKVLSTFSKKEKFQMIDDTIVCAGGANCGDLLSICVLPGCQGNGMAQALISAYEQALRDAGRQGCLLTVSVTNDRAIRFYERNGYAPRMELPGVARNYAKRL